MFARLTCILGVALVGLSGNTLVRADDLACDEGTMGRGEVWVLRLTAARIDGNEIDITTDVFAYLGPRIASAPQPLTVVWERGAVLGAVSAPRLPASWTPWQ